MFSTLPKGNFDFSIPFIVLSAYSFNLDQSKNLLFGRVNLCSADAFNLDQVKILSFGKGLRKKMSEITYLKKSLNHNIIKHLKNSYVDVFATAATHG